MSESPPRDEEDDHDLWLFGINPNVFADDQDRISDFDPREVQADSSLATGFDLDDSEVQFTNNDVEETDQGPSATQSQPLASESFEDQATEAYNPFGEMSDMELLGIESNPYPNMSDMELLGIHNGEHAETLQNEPTLLHPQPTRRIPLLTEFLDASLPPRPEQDSESEDNSMSSDQESEQEEQQEESQTEAPSAPWGHQTSMMSKWRYRKQSAGSRTKRRVAPADEAELARRAARNRQRAHDRRIQRRLESEMRIRTRVIRPEDRETVDASAGAPGASDASAPQTQAILAEGPVNDEIHNPIPRNFSMIRRQGDKRVFEAEVPRKDPTHPWVKPNQELARTTRPRASTRSGKINRYDPAQVYRQDTAAIVGDWTSPNGHAFNYSPHGELLGPSYSTEAIRDFLAWHPMNTTPEHLVLWIQRSPADSARRYNTADSGRCRFAECFNAATLNRIAVGEYRVTVDERWNTHQGAVDPMNVAMHFHLYCFERLLNLYDLTRQCDIRADNRSLVNEPKGVWLAGLVDRNIRPLRAAENFINLARQDDPQMFEAAWPEYPAAPVPGGPGNFWNYHRTLCYRMNIGKFNGSAPRRRLYFEEAGVKSTKSFIHHMGNFDVASEPAPSRMARYIAAIIIPSVTQKKAARGATAGADDAQTGQKRPREDDSDSPGEGPSSKRPRLQD